MKRKGLVLLFLVLFMGQLLAIVSHDAELLIEAYIPNASTGTKHSELIVSDLSLTGGRVLVNNGAVLDLGRGENLLSSVTELFEVSYVTNSPEMVKLTVQVGDFYLVTRNSDGSYEQYEDANGQPITIPTNVERATSYAFSNINDVGNSSDLDNLEGVEFSEKPEWGAHGFEFVSENENGSAESSDETFSFQYRLDKVSNISDNVWTMNEREVWFETEYYWTYDGCTVAYDKDAILEGTFELRQTFSISFDESAVKNYKPGYYKLDVTVTQEAV